jgi:hypothetical protein
VAPRRFPARSAKLTQLTRDPLLEVVPSPEVRRSHIDNVDAAHKEFGVNLVLEGNLHTAGRQIRINFILVEARTRRQLRANSLTLSDDDAFHIEDAVVSAVFEMLGMSTRATEHAARETHRAQVASAYDYYLQGVGYLQNYDRQENLDNAIQVFQHALELDRNTLWPTPVSAKPSSRNAPLRNNLRRFSRAAILVGWRISWIHNSPPPMLV